MSWKPPESDFDWQPPDSDFQSQAVPATQPQEPSLIETAGQAAKRLVTAPIETAKNLTPEKMSPYLPVAGTIVGSAFAPGIGTAAGAGLGQIGARMADIAYGRAEPAEAMSPVKEAIGPMVQTALSGLPETAGAKKAISIIGKGLAKAGQTLSGAKQDVLEQAAKQGYKTYGAPSIERAQEIFGEAIGPEGKAAMKISAADAFSPELGKARSIAAEIGTKLENGEPVTALEALKARQATDRVISATSAKDKMARASLFEWRKKFDDVMTSQSGPLKNASTKYRQAIVKSQLLSPTRLNKGGEPSAFLPMLVGHGMIGKGVGGGFGMLTGSSPLVWGLGATTVGAISPGFRRAVMTELIDRIIVGKKGP